ncbi:hypothetical protein BB560_003375, partial [Smittium megazygosporum]
HLSTTIIAKSLKEMFVIIDSDLQYLDAICSIRKRCRLKNILCVSTDHMQNLTYCGKSLSYLVLSCGIVSVVRSIP